MIFDFRKLDAHCRFTIPYAIRKELGLDANSFVKVDVKNGSIILRPLEVEVRLKGEQKEDV